MRSMFIFSAISILGISLVFNGSVFAQGIPAPYRSGASGAGMGNTTTSSDGHTAREEAKGKIVWEKLQAKQVQCPGLSDEDFGVLGEYFMGQMTGTSHEAMNTMMEQMMGQEGEEQMHVVMGKRLSGCDTSAAIPSPGVGFMPLIQMLAPYGTAGSRTGMMGGGLFGWIFMILWWVLIIAGIVALIKWLTSQSRGTHNQEKPFDFAQGKSPLEILKERYAKGEVDKKEFEDKKRDLT